MKLMLKMKILVILICLCGLASANFGFNSKSLPQTNIFEQRRPLSDQCFCKLKGKFKYDLR